MPKTALRRWSVLMTRLNHGVPCFPCACNVPVDVLPWPSLIARIPHQWHSQERLRPSGRFPFLGKEFFLFLLLRTATMIELAPYSARRAFPRPLCFCVFGAIVVLARPNSSTETLAAFILSPLSTRGAANRSQLTPHCCVSSYSDPTATVTRERFDLFLVPLNTS
jgi:hypothetical protein